MNFVPRASYVKPRTPYRDERRAVQEPAKRSWPSWKVVVLSVGGSSQEASGSGPRDDGGSGGVRSNGSDGGEKRAGKGALTCPDTRPVVVEDEVTDWDRGHGCTGSRLCNTKSTTVVAMAASECGDARELATVP